MRRRTQQIPLLGLLSLVLSPVTFAGLQVSSVDPPSIVDNVGKMAVVGQFDGISQYSYSGQQTSISTSYFDSIIAQIDDDIFINQGTSNGRVSAVCQIDDSVFMAGNFSSIGTLSTPGGFAMLNASNGDISALTQSFNGTILTLYCNSSSNSVYAGGNFTYLNSTGTAIYDVSGSSWSIPTFGGFSEGASIHSILAVNNSLIFAGSFDGLANDSYTGSTTTQGNSTLLRSQRISFNSSTITAAGTADNNDPRSITCPSNNISWAMDGGQVGSWSAAWPFTFQPTMLRIYNLKKDNEGVKMFRLLSFPSNGIMNLTYTNSSTSETVYCDAWCDLPLSSDDEFVDFDFVNTISTTGFQIEILDTYNGLGGLSGIELFQNDIITYANESYNQQGNCVLANEVGASSLNGSFVEPDVSGSTYVSINISDSSLLSDVSVRFEPNITIAGNYSVLLFTPGCVQDGTCSSRAGVTVGVQATESGDAVYTTLFESNDYDKYDTIFTGDMDKISDGFRPYVTVRPSADSAPPFIFVADRIQVVLNSFEEHITINAIFEFDPSNFTNMDSTTLPVGNTTINSIGSALNSSSKINVLYSDNNDILIGGDFSSSEFGDNIIRVTSGTAQVVSGNGLNGAVNGLQSYSNGSVVAFGNFTSTANTASNGTNHLAVYNLQDDTWSSLGHGTNGEVTQATTFMVNGTSTLGFSGNFDKIYDNTSQSTSVDGFGIWVTDESSWFQSSTLSSIFLQARLSTYASFNGTAFYSGFVRMFQASSSGSSFVGSDLSVTRTPYEFITNDVAGNVTKLQKRNTILQTGDNAVNAGAFVNSTFSILGGHFEAQSLGQNYSNLIMINDGVVQGLPDGLNNDTTVYDIFINSGVLYAGGDFTGNISSNVVSGLFFYDLDKNDYMNIQPPGVYGDQAVVTSIDIRPNTDQLIVAGSFEQAGSMACPSLCMYDLSENRWTSPSPGLSGTVSSMAFVGSNVLVIAGELELNSTRVFLAQYNFATTKYSTYGEQSTSLSGPINSFVLNGNQVDSVFASGLDSSTGDAYLSHWNGSTWNSIDSLFETGTVITEVSMMELQNEHSSNGVLPVNEVLLVSGNIVLKDFGNASSVFFDGSSWQPAFLTTTSEGGSGLINSFVSQSSQSFSEVLTEGHLARGIVVVISLAIAIGLTFLCVGLGLAIAYYRKRSQGYMEAPSRVSEAEMAETVPPESLFQEMSSNTGGPRRRASGLL